MQRNLLHRQRALFLRRKNGYSYTEILTEIPVAKSTLSEWLHNFPLSPKQQERLYQKQVLINWNLGEWNRKRRQMEIIKIRATAKEAMKPVTKNQLFLAGIMLYWAEGDKGGKEVRFSNSDALLIKLMMRWLRECLHIPDKHFRTQLHYHAGQNQEQIKKYWSGSTGIPLRQFIKSFCKPPGTGHRTHVLQWGTLNIRVCKSANLYHQIVGWRDGLIHDIISGKQL